LDNRNFLSQALVLERFIETKKETLRIHRERMEYMSPDVTKDKISSGRENTVLNSADAMLQIEKNIIADISEFKQRYAEIEKAIREVPDLEQREILEMKYIQGKSVRVIALAKGYSTRQLRRKLREAEMSVKPPKYGRSQQVAGKLK